MTDLIFNFHTCQRKHIIRRKIDLKRFSFQFLWPLIDFVILTNHFFAVVNSRESRVEEKYRCFVSLPC